MVRHAREAGLACIALTDHDTVAGVAEAMAEGDRCGVRVLAGCEFSVQVAWGEMHLLGYGLPVGDPAVEAFLVDARNMRLERARRMVGHLQAWGMDIELSHVMEEAGGAAVGRPHVARALVRRGKVVDVEAAFQEFLGQGRRAYVEKVLPTLRDVADLVHGAGGVVAAAHLRDRGSRTVLRMLMEDGMDGVEVVHPSHSPEIRAQLDRAARALGLLRSGGSDWHGDTGAGDHGQIGGHFVPMEWVDALTDGPAPGNSGRDGVVEAEA